MEEAMNAAPVPFVMAMVLGTIKRPKLTNVTTGKWTGKSLVFHTQEETEYVESNGDMVTFGKFYEYHRRTVNKTTEAPRPVQMSLQGKPIGTSTRPLPRDR